MKCAADSEGVSLIFVHPFGYTTFIFVKYDDMPVTFPTKQTFKFTRTTEITLGSGHDSPSLSLLRHGVVDLDDAFTSLPNTSLNLPSIPDCWIPVTIVHTQKYSNSATLTNAFAPFP